MDDLDDLLSSVLLTEAQVLAEIDEYRLYCHYLGFQPDLGRAYQSPLRRDDKPSFSVFETRLERECEFRWKDNALNYSGDIFDLVRRIHGLRTRQEALKQVDSFFNLGLASVPTAPKDTIKYERPAKKEAAQIKIKSLPFSGPALEYWASYGISEATLKLYLVQQVSGFWTHPEQYAPFTPPGLCFAYQIGSFYKIYQPFNKACKFLNNFPENYAEGYIQLPEKGPLLVFTKSTKDCMVLHSLGYAAVSPRSESTPFPALLLERLSSRFTRIVTFFDNDYGKDRNHGQELAKQYSFPSVCIPDKFAKEGAKDISDFRKLYGEAATRTLLTSLLHDSNF